MNEALYNLQVICNGLGELAYRHRKQRAKNRPKVQYNYHTSYSWEVRNVSRLKREEARIKREGWVKSMKAPETF